MTFSAEGEAHGQAVLVPCQANVATIEDLVTEAQHLWKAEKPTATGKKIGASWGCVGALFANDDLREQWLAPWSKVFSKSAAAIPPVDRFGQFGVPWPTKVLTGEPADSDVILATATRPNEEPPSAETVASAWVNQNEGRERYFFNNVGSGIRTAQDAEIWRRITEANPAWLTESDRRLFA